MLPRLGAAQSQERATAKLQEDLADVSCFLPMMVKSVNIDCGVECRSGMAFNVSIRVPGGNYVVASHGNCLARLLHRNFELTLEEV